MMWQLEKQVYKMVKSKLCVGAFLIVLLMKFTSLYSDIDQHVIINSRKY